MERFISLRIDQTGPDTVRLHYDYGPGHPAPPPVEVELADVQERLDRAETDYYAELPADPEERTRHLEALVAYGRELYTLLDTPQRLLSGYAQRTAGEWDVLVLSLSVGHEGARFAHLPWELLHDGETFLVTAANPVVPVRRVPGASVGRPCAERPLRLLFMACAPDLDTFGSLGSLGSLDYDAEQGRIWEATRRQGIDLEVEESGDLDELEERVHNHPEGAIDVVHLTGHAVHADDGPKFLTEDRMGRPRRAGFQDLHRCLAGRAGVLVLSGCRTGEAGDAGDVASLAERLARSTAPVVLGWGRPVADGAATRAAAVFYRWLARGVSPTTALAKTFGEMNSEVPYWHLLRMFLRGDPPGPLVEPARQRGGVRRPRDTIAGGEQVPGKAEPNYPDPLRFVGRRREVQRAIRVLGPFGEARDSRPGLVVQGMGGIGKTTLVGRVCHRLEDQFHLVVLRLGDDYLTKEYLRRVLMSDDELADLLEGTGTDAHFMKRLAAAFRRYPGNLLFWLDEFETNFRPDDTTVTDIAMEDERPVAQSVAVEVLTELVNALAPARTGHRIVVTSRYPLNLPCTEGFGTITLNPPREEEISRLIDRLRADQPEAGLPPERINAVREAAGGNPRLLDNLFRAACQGIDVGNDLLRVRMREARDRMLDADIVLPLLLAKVSESSRKLLATAAPYRTPVPAGALARLMDEPTDRVLERAGKLAGLNLLECTRGNGAPRFVVPLMLRPRLSAEDAVVRRAARCATALAAELGDFLDEPDVRRLDQPLLQEVRRLALEGGKTGLAVDATVALANIHDTYGRYREVAALCYQMLHQAPEHRLYRILAKSESELGHASDAIRYFDHALTKCPPETDRQRAETLVSAAFEFTYSLPGTTESVRMAQLTEAMELARRHGGIQPVLVWALRTMARILALTGDLGRRPTITALLDEAQEIARTIPDGGGQANAVRYDRLWALLLDGGDYRAVEAELAAILKVFEQLGQRRNAAVVLLDAANNWLSLGEADQAEKLADKIRDLNRYMDAAQLDERLDLLHGHIALGRNDFDGAEQHYEIAARKAATLRDEGGEIAALSGRVLCRRRLGDRKGADRLVRQQLLRQEKLRSPTYRVDLLLAALDHYDMTSEADEADAREALEMSREAASLAHAHGQLARELRAWEFFCAAADRLGGPVDEHEAALRRILELQPDSATRLPTLIRLGRLLLGAERFAAARPPLAEALASEIEYGQEAEVRGLLAEAARGNQDQEAAAEQLTALVLLRLEADKADAEADSVALALAVGTLRELAAVHLAGPARDLARERLLDARSLARTIPSAELEHAALEDLVTFAEQHGTAAEAGRWEAAAYSADLRRLPLRVLLTEDVSRFFDSAQGGTAIEQTNVIRTRLHEEKGWSLPGVRYSHGDDLPARSYAILIWGQTVHQGELPTDHVLIPARPHDTRTGRITTEIGLPGVEWLTEEEAAGLPTQDPSRVVLANLYTVASRNQARLESLTEPAPPPEPGIEDFTVPQILDRIRGSAPTLRGSTPA